MTRFGSNLGYVDDLYQRYLEDPSSVSAAWREFFADYSPQVARREPASPGPAGAGAPERAPAQAPPPRSATPSGSPASSPTSPSSASAASAGTVVRRKPVLPPSEVARAAAPTETPVRPEPTPAADAGADAEVGEPLRGAAARIADNMEQSLGVPTATSARAMPVKLLEENRRLINQHQHATARRKVSFTHLIAWALVKALGRHPTMNHGFERVEGIARRIHRDSVHLGLAIDVERRDGERSLLVPNIKDSGSLSFPDFHAAYNDLVLRARAGKLTVDDFQGTTVTLTNPGTIGTVLSVPRLMAGQGTIVGIGAIGHTPEYSGMSPRTVAELGISRVMTLTSTYDHRIIQGAESGAFLATIEGLLRGEEGFYEHLFRDLGVPQQPVAWSLDEDPPMLEGGEPGRAAVKQARVMQLIHAFRVRGHLMTKLDPLGDPPEPYPELEMKHHGLSLWDLDREFLTGGVAGTAAPMKLRDILDTLRQTYCLYTGIEYMHITDLEERGWLQERMESTRNQEPLDLDMKLHILHKLNQAEAFERFLHSTYVGHKRFSLEGCETLIPVLDALFTDAARDDIQEAVIGMSHRGRLNVLGNIIGKSVTQVFREFEDADPETMEGSGDVMYHLGAEGSHRTPEGEEVRLTLASNPSHLESVDPVVEGMARAIQDRLGDGARLRVLPVLIHGDAAFSGQGVVFETLNLSQLRGYRTGGTVHVVVNNQIGFTTAPADARSTFYTTDVAKAVRAPIFHVNADHPQAAVRMIRLALAYRQRFQRDVVVDLVCYRRWGHNETDEPAFTQPLMVEKIRAKRSVRKLATERLLLRDEIDLETAERMLEEFQEYYDRAHREVRRALEGALGPSPRPDLEAREGLARAPVDTAVGGARLEMVLEGLSRVPDGFEPHPKLLRQLRRREERFREDRIDWGTAELLAFGCLVKEGTPVRLSGQDSARGTFSQRHAVLLDHRSAAAHLPLQHIAPEQAPFQVYDSLLSELAVLGFEYGYSVVRPEALVIWEAQFGDFVNGAQVILDQYISSAEEKWGQRSSLVMLLPHGHEGQGPEHSSARLERFLQLASEGNLRIAQPSTPAQHFHLLRRQALAEERKPLVVMTPKSLLRLPAAVSRRDELTGGTFREVIGDERVADGRRARRLILTSGKLYYHLAGRRAEGGIDDVALARIEQFYPFPRRQIGSILEEHAEARQVVWAQEEPRNMGAWDFLDERLRELLQRGQELSYLGRPWGASPATGSHARHVAEERSIVEEALGSD